MMSLLLVLSPSHLCGARVIGETDDSSGTGFVLDRDHPLKPNEKIWVHRNYVTTAEVPECCWAPDKAEPAHRLYAAYNLGLRGERAGLAWNGQPVPTWAELRQRAHDGEPGAIGVIEKWEAVAQAVDRMGDFRTFGWALRQLKNGHRVRRSGWNGKGMWLCLSGTDGTREVPAAGFWAQPNREYAESQGGTAKVLPCICMKTATGEILMGWLASQTDMLAEDWEYAE